MTVYIGTSGWQYGHWKDLFYEGVPRRLWLGHYARHFRTVESNAAFYRLPEEKTFAKWAKETPDDFVLALKASRYLTHIKRLKEPREPVERMLAHASPLGPKLGPVLLQLPPTLKADLRSLEATLAAIGDRARVAVEFRHDSWFTEDTRRLLERHGAALCLADRGSRPVAPLWRTTVWTYLRLHWGTGAPPGCYGRGALARWVERLEKGWGREEDFFVYFNNDPHGCAVRDAVTFGRLAARVGLEPTRFPEPAPSVQDV